MRTVRHDPHVGSGRILCANADSDGVSACESLSQSRGDHRSCILKQSPSPRYGWRSYLESLVGTARKWLRPCASVAHPITPGQQLLELFG